MVPAMAVHYGSSAGRDEYMGIQDEPQGGGCDADLCDAVSGNRCCFVFL